MTHTVKMTIQGTTRYSEQAIIRHLLNEMIEDILTNKEYNLEKIKKEQSTEYTLSLEIFSVENLQKQRDNENLIDALF